uniref:Uncharacterized protein n=1 Tax=Arundo donax TaxID=35708 RepID=A0A0A8ZKQ5_ARUDO
MPPDQAGGGSDPPDSRRSRVPARCSMECHHRPCTPKTSSSWHHVPARPWIPVE